MQAGIGLGNALQAGKSHFPYIFRKHFVSDNHVPYQFFHGRKPAGIGLFGMQLTRQDGKTDRQRFQLLRFLGYDAGEGAFAGDEFVLGAVARPVRNEPKGLGSGNTQLIHYLIYVELARGGLGLHAGHEKLRQRRTVFFVICQGCTAFPRLEIVFQFNFLVSIHLFY